MNENIYYMSIQSTSLAHYFGRGLILSSRFYTNRPSDMQNIESDYLVLSKNKFLNNSNCSIKLVLKKEEVNSLIEIEDTNIFLYSKPIPISRIKQVYFRDEIQELKTIDNINRGTAFIPTTLSKVIEEESINRDIIVKDTFKYSPELESRIKTYNHILGGLAFVKYTLEEEYAKNYFSILSHFNNFIQNKINNRFDKYDGAFTHDGDFWSKLSPLLYETISEKDVLNFSEQEKVVIEKSNGIFKYENIDKKSITYKLAILNIYGEDSTKKKNTDHLISDCKNGKIPKEKQEGIALIYGINHGYLSFRNQYNKKIVKFKMDSLLDYYTIESVFQYVINDKKDSERFEYIDKIFPNEELVLDIKEEAFNLEAYLKEIFNYLKDNLFKLSPKELFSNVLDKFKNTFIAEMNKKDSELKEKEEKINILTQMLNISKESLKNTEQEVKELNNRLEEKNQELKIEKNNNQKLIIDKNKKIKTLEEKQKKIDELNKTISEKEQDIETKNQKLEAEKIKNDDTTFDKEKEIIIIEQTLESYLKYDSKKVPELRKIAKEKGIKYTNKPDTIKLILAHEDNRLL